MFLRFDKLLNIKYFVLFISISFYFIYLSFILSKGFIENDETSDKVFLILSVISIEISYLLLSNNFINYSIKKISDKLFLVIFFCLTFIIWNKETVLSYIDVVYFFLFHFFLFFIVLRFIIFSKIYKLENIENYQITLVAILSIILSGIFYQIDYSEKNSYINIIILSIILLLLSLLLKNKLNKKFDLFLSIGLFLTLLKVFILSSTKDSFHYSWYLGPANSISTDYNLLQNIPSQYGFLNIELVNIFSDMLNIDSSLSIIILIVFFLLIFLCIFFIKINDILNFSYTATALFLGSLVFGSIGYNNLLGAVFIPSSSVFRFLPSLITILFLSKIVVKECSFNLKNAFLLYFLFFLSLIWSFESAFFVILPLCSFLFFLIFMNLRSFSKTILVLKNLNRSKLQILLGIFMLIVFFFFFKEKNIYLYYEHALNTSSSLAKEIVSNKITLVYLYILFLSYFILRDSLIHKNFFITNILWFSLLTSYSTYFMVRSVDSNFINIFPFLIFIICSMKILSQDIRILRNISIIIVFFYVIISSCYSIILNNDKFLKNLLLPTFFVTPSYLSENYIPNTTILKKINEYDNLNLTLISGETIHKPNIHLANKGYGLPILPLESFNILNKKTKQTLMDDYFKKNSKHLVLCLFDCKFYRSNLDDDFYNKIFLGENLNFKLLSSFQSKDVNEYLYLIF
jgi:hypothetical protein